MSDPHVVRLTYRFVTANEFDRFSNAKPLSVTAEGFDLHLEDGLLTATPANHFASVDGARAAIEPYLRSWAASARLGRPRRDVRFDFDDFYVVDRVDGSTVYPAVARAHGAAANAVILVDNGDYPAPPQGFRTDLVLDEMLARLADLDHGRTSITDATYWVVTRVEAAFGVGSGSGLRQSAASAIGVDYDILSTMGRLASQNDPILGRKAKGVPRALTAAEKAWMRAAIVLVAGQIGAVNAGVSTARKTMADLPSL